MITKSAIISALKASGLSGARPVFIHSNLAFFGPAKGVCSMGAISELYLECILKVAGPGATLVFPMFTYSFGNDKKEKIFDPSKLVKGMCPMGNWLLSGEAGERSLDPMLSVLCYGQDEKALASFDDDHCFGEASLWAKLYNSDAIICNLNFDSGSTYLHWVEKQAEVPYRKDITFSGLVKSKMKLLRRNIVYYGRDLDFPNSQPDFRDYHNLCVDTGVSRCIRLGRGQIVTQSCRDAKSLVMKMISAKPNLLIAGN
jgi:aminoglycoside 3-N-acetyltransferase